MSVKNPSQALEAIESFAYLDEHTGRKQIVQAGTTRVAASSEVAQRFPQHFREIELSYSDMEEATDEPGRQRVRGRRRAPGASPEGRATPVSTP